MATKLNIAKRFANIIDAAQGRMPRYHEDGLPQGRIALMSALGIRVHRRDGSIEERGVVGRRCVTTAFTNYLVTVFSNSTTAPLDTFKYHAPGSGTTAEATGDTSMYTAVGARGTGTNTAATNVFTSVCTVTFTAAASITEHGLFNAATGVTLMDRTSFAAVSVASGDSIGFTYQLTATAGG